MNIATKYASKVHKSQKWRHKKTGKIAVIISEPDSCFADIHLLHESGRNTYKQQHYFLYEYEIMEDK